MRHRLLLVIGVLFVCITLSAQDIDLWVKSKQPVLFEKLYIHVDRELYAPGDKIWMKVYQVNGITHKLNSNFRNIFVQLIADNGKVVSEHVLFSIKGQAQGQIDTRGLESGNYTIRAYTKYLKNFGEEALFHKRISIVRAINSDQLNASGQTGYSNLDMSFLPEGGNLITNAVNNVAFKAIDTKGKGVYVSGMIIDNAGDTVTRFSTTFRGMGKFLLMPVEGEQYYALIDQEPSLKIKLENTRTDGITLNARDAGDSFLFGMAVNMRESILPKFYLVASHKGVVLFYRKIEMNEVVHSLKIPKNQFPKGISRISLLDLSLNPLAERLIFVDDGKPDILQIKLSKSDFMPREEVTIDLDAELSSGDSINSTLSMAVVNRSYLNSGGNSQNIKSYLLLDSDLRGAIEAPASYFVGDETCTSSEKLDLLMLVHGWKSYYWDEVEKMPQQPIDAWNDAGINIKGVVKKLLREIPVPDAKVVLGPAGGSFLVMETTTDSAGRFEFKHIYLRDSTQVMINARNKNGGKNNRILLDPAFVKETEINSELINQAVFPIEPHRKFFMDSYYRRMKELGYNPQKGSILLSEVEVIEDRIPKEATQLKIYQNADKSFKISPSDFSYNSIFEYLDGLVPGLTVTGEQISIRGGGMPLFMIDGIEVSDFPPGSGNLLREIRSLRMSEIDKIDILKSGGNLSAFGSKGANGVIAIYRKTGDYTENKDYYIWGRITEQINGYQRIGQFYSPKYTPENIDSPLPDFRPTLYWNPEITLTEGKGRLSFFTSDELAKYDVIVEGISKNGKICFGTASFSVDKK